ncbi:hypothetical protein [Methylomonas rhizoryzae]|uniref:hypothetical protein n=1 Tax=Methylomonas rhizoryzae TaxID=2608981 RepID=UPI001232EBC9|nr:hypothetical protein [Methylomonas rhizoryzae]
MAGYEYSREEITIDARAHGWDIFKPDWDYLQSFPALSLCSLVGLSVGLSPWFTRPDWVFRCAKPYFDGKRDPDFDEAVTEQDSAKAEALGLFLKRIHIAVGNLAPAGSLNSISGIPQGEATFVNVAEFLAFAGRLGWELPEEFRRFDAEHDLNYSAHEAKTPLETNGKTTKTNQLHVLIWRVFLALKSKGGKPTAQDIWNEIRFRHSEHDVDNIIQEVTADVIEWRSCYGNESILNRGSFDKTLSNLKKNPPF